MQEQHIVCLKVLPLAFKGIYVGDQFEYSIYI